MLTLVIAIAISTVILYSKIESNKTAGWLGIFNLMKIYIPTLLGLCENQQN